MRIFDIKKFREFKKGKKFEFKLTGNFMVIDYYLRIEVIITADNAIEHTAYIFISNEHPDIFYPFVLLPKSYVDEVTTFFEELSESQDFQNFYNTGFAEFLKFPKVDSSEGDIVCHQFRMLKSMYDGENTFLGSFYIDTDENKIVRTEEADE